MKITVLVCCLGGARGGGLFVWELVLEFLVETRLFYRALIGDKNVYGTRARVGDIFCGGCIRPC